MSGHVENRHSCYIAIVHIIMLCAILFLSVILSGCGSSSTDDTGSVYDAENGYDAGSADANAVDIADGQGILTEETEEALIPESSWTNPAVLEADEREITLQDGNLLYGNLRLELREGIEAEVLQAEEYGNFFAEWEDGTVVALPGAEEIYKRQGEFAPVDLPLPPRIRFMHYRAEYENETELISALFSLIPDALGERVYADDEKCEYAYWMRWGVCQYFIFVQKEEVYLIQEIQGRDARWFGHFTVDCLLSDKVMFWQDSGTVICPDRAEEVLYRPGDKEENEYDAAQAEVILDISADSWYSWTLETKIIPEPQYIPQELLDELADAVLLGTEAEMKAVSEMHIDREISREEMLLLAERSRDIFIQMVSDPYYSGCWVTAEADCDNDGIQDIIVQLLNGGSAGNLDYVFFKGQPDGTYVRTSKLDSFEEEFAVISYQGKNYLCRMPFDIDRRINYGFTIIAYEDGERVEEVSLTLVPKNYDMRIISNMEGNTAKDTSNDYGPLTDDIAETCFTIEAQLAECEIVVGSAEQEVYKTDDEGSYRCDLDNDGEAERYEKRIWKSHHRLTSELVFTCEDETKAGILLLQEKMKEEGTPLMLWVESCGGENIINVFYRTGQEDFKIAGFLAGENDCRKVYEVAADARYEVKQSCQAIYDNET